MTNIIDKMDRDKLSEAVKKTKEKYNISEKEAEQYLVSLGPKSLKNKGLFNNSYEWRAGFTKQTLEKRKIDRRKKNKITRQTRRKQRI